MTPNGMAAIWFASFTPTTTTTPTTTDAWRGSSSIIIGGAFESSFRMTASSCRHPPSPPRRGVVQRPRSSRVRYYYARGARSSMTNDDYYYVDDDDGVGGCIPLSAGDTMIVIERIALDDFDGLERMSKFCIDSFYDDDDDDDDGDGSSLSRIWKDIKLLAMRRAQLLDISLSSDEFGRCIFVAKALATDTKSEEIVGCCEVIEERLDISQRPPATTRFVRGRSRTARRRPLIENLCVKRGYRRSGVGVALVRACEGAVRLWAGAGRDEIFSQVDEDNVHAYNLFRKCGYTCLYADRTCTRVVLDDVLFAKEVPVTKQMMRKMLIDQVSLDK